MYDLIVDFIGYTGTTNYQSTVLYACIVVLLLAVTLTVDLIYKLFLRFLPNNSK